MTHIGAVLVILAACLAQAAPGPGHTSGSVARAPAPATPDEVMARFARLDAEGSQLTPAGWEKVAALFTTPGPRRTDPRLSIVKDRYGVPKAVMSNERTAEARVEYTHLGFLDMTTGMFTNEHSGLYLREDRRLVLVAGPTGTAVWKIEGAVPDPNVTRTAAIRYVTERLRSTRDTHIAQNLRRALAALRRQR